MIDNIYKISTLIIGISFLLLLAGIYNKMDSSIGRYQSGDGFTIDTKTGVRYYPKHGGRTYFSYDKNGNQVETKLFFN